MTATVNLRRFLPWVLAMSLCFWSLNIQGGPDTRPGDGVGGAIRLGGMGGVSIDTCASQLVATAHGKKIESVVWEWPDLKKPGRKTTFEKVSHAVRSAAGVVTLESGAEEPATEALVLRDEASGKERFRQPIDKKWYALEMRSSRNGKFVAILLESLAAALQEGKGQRIQVGVLDVVLGKLNWAKDFAPSEVSVVMKIAVSDDGNTVGIAGYPTASSLSACDLKKGGLIWSSRIEGSSGLTDVAVSADGKFLWTCGTSKAVFKIAKESGKLVWTGLAVGRDKGRHLYSVDRLALAADSGTVACGTTDGLVFIWSDNGDMLAELNIDQGIVRGLAFSPDSRRLAVSCSESRDISVLAINVRTTTAPSTREAGK